MTCERTLYTVTELRQIEQAALASLLPSTLMRRAGLAAAELALRLLSDNRDSKVLVLAGPGNNGGDAFEMARQLADAGMNVTVMFNGDATKLPIDAAQAFQHARNKKSLVITSINSTAITTTNWGLVADGLFGIGLTHPIQDDFRKSIEAVNTLHCPVLALDIPSGLNADTGTIIGGDSAIAVRATDTITFIGNKPGLHTGDGRDYAGNVHVARLDVASKHFVESARELNNVSLFAAALKPRLQNSHKGSYGDVIVLGGASGMVGAAILSARTAAKCGAGRVLIASPDNALAYDDVQPEIMCRRAQDTDFNKATIVAGPGLGISREAHDFLSKVIGTRSPLVIDADALNLIAAEHGLQQKLRSRNAATILTPHPLEAARLLGNSTQDVQADRMTAAIVLAEKFNAIVILKGSGTVIANPDGRIIINTTGNPALATAGAGDVLAGLCGALLAQRWPADAASRGAAWLHGQAADDLVESGIGPIGVSASELIPCIRSALNRLVLQESAHSASVKSNGPRQS